MKLAGGIVEKLDSNQNIGNLLAVSPDVLHGSRTYAARNSAQRFDTAEPVLNAVLNEVIPIFAGLNPKVSLTQTVDSRCFDFYHVQVFDLIGDHHVAATAENKPVFAASPYFAHALD